MKTVIIKSKISDENIGIELFKNNNDKYGVRIYDVDANENYECKLFNSKILAYDYYEENK